MDEFIILSQQDLRAAMRFGDYVDAVAAASGCSRKAGARRRCRRRSTSRTAPFTSSRRACRADRATLPSR